MSKYYAASTGGFYSHEINGDDIPGDAVEITDGEWQELLKGQSNGKMISSDSKGNPVLIDFPKPTQSEFILQANSKKATLIAEATVKIGPLQDADDLGIATNEEASELKAWKTHRVMLNRVDTSQAPDIEWPVSPE
ncbi:tail fiber assembly protein [Yersinia intermedia]|uniref:tail fiber assembly protein n=1 Tax=Yersinia intermedia TaxID=631 RepID=UPI0039C67F0D